MEKETRLSHEDLEQQYGPYFQYVLETQMYVDRPDLLASGENIADRNAEIFERATSECYEHIGEISDDNSILFWDERERKINQEFGNMHFAASHALVQAFNGYKPVAEVPARSGYRYAPSAQTINWYHDVKAAWVNQVVDGNAETLVRDHTYQGVVNELADMIAKAKQPRHWQSEGVDYNDIDMTLVGQLAFALRRIKQAGSLLGLSTHEGHGI